MKNQEKPKEEFTLSVSEDGNLELKCPREIPPGSSGTVWKGDSLTPHSLCTFLAYLQDGKSIVTAYEIVMDNYQHAKALNQATELIKQ